MPGSNTPNPPGSQIHCWPGCHLCTSSCQKISIERIRLPASAFAALSTVEWCCACQVVNNVTCCASARQARSLISASPAEAQQVTLFTTWHAQHHSTVDN